MKPRALIFWGGWEGHLPEPTTKILANGLKKHGFDVVIENNLECLNDAKALKKFKLIVPNWTMCLTPLSPEATANLTGAVRNHGVGLAGIHGGAGDAFRANFEYEMMVGGIFVSHPHVGDYKVRVKDPFNPIMEGMPKMFDYNSEQYYMLTDTNNHVLAETEYVFDGKAFSMPVAWIKQWGKGRVFYSSLGHDVPKEFKEHPYVQKMTLRGMMWAAGLL